ncbi:hypothetical protein [Streptomyces sp. NPDC002889]|uniref:hypothetical protein n=1 Tax=Streptomyces sp. NPDC002889 TaxID=3364669 RepID=UPI00369F516F
MLLRRDPRHRIPVAAGVLLGMLLALLVGSTTPATASAGPLPIVGMSDPVQAPGCGKGASDDGNGADPATPVRGGSVCELLPAPHTGHGAPGSAWGLAEPVRAPVPDRGPPPLAPPSPVDLSVLRV